MCNKPEDLALEAGWRAVGPQELFDAVYQPPALELQLIVLCDDALHL